MSGQSEYEIVCNIVVENTSCFSLEIRQGLSRNVSSVLD